MARRFHSRTDDFGRVLMQRRAAMKYHSPGLWSNTCCGHPRPGEPTVDAAGRRLSEEMGISCELVPLRTFAYRADLGAGLVEHEIDHVFIGRTMQAPRPDPAEVEAWRWLDSDELRIWLQLRPENFTAWFPAVFATLGSRQARAASLD